MGRQFNILAMVLVILLVGAGCQALTGRTVGENIDDAAITASVKTKLVADKATNLTRVDVDTNNKIVYLNGTVESTEQKARAEQLASQVNGVRNVVNNLEVQRR